MPSDEQQLPSDPVGSSPTKVVDSHQEGDTTTAPTCSLKRRRDPLDKATSSAEPASPSASSATSSSSSAHDDEEEAAERSPSPSSTSPLSADQGEADSVHSSPSKKVKLQTPDTPGSPTPAATTDKAAGDLPAESDQEEEASPDAPSPCSASTAPPATTTSTSDAPTTADAPTPAAATTITSDPAVTTEAGPSCPSPKPTEIPLTSTGCPQSTSLATKASTLHIDETKTEPAAAAIPLPTGFGSSKMSASPFAALASPGSTPAFGSAAPQATFGSAFSGSTFASFATLASTSSSGPSIFATAPSMFGNPDRKTLGKAAGATKARPEADDSDHTDEEGSDADSGAEGSPSDGSDDESGGLSLGKDTTAGLKDPRFTPVEVATGEEDETTLCSAKCKLYAMDDGMTWRERGTGTVKVNQRNDDPKSVRLVMRTDVVFKVVLNVKVTSHMSCELAQDRFLRMSTVDPTSGVQNYALRVLSKPLAQDMFDTITKAIASS
ncbi:hypothetical protein BJ085DRAFT_36889 [Dimargaris cristalligena]|uniref:RanBD1 domain-containing protein n=1 Tax=Dimargaris cristalligena TaxID=215637 RepID=A0A4P9ZRI5_9FUNG|nr:hypothetical protein BJ085DRAFT_36889 [Dimargaris cristalligena]|eukprot:RKP36146.1 hypothetical protein BJ085DRAFT_36889 [Dimargaris cristalligena]